MKKHRYFIPLIFISIVACTSKSDSVESVFQQLEQTQATEKKLNKRSHKIKPEGIISVDITADNNQLHLLTGKQLHGQKTLWYQHSKDGGISWSTAQKVLGDDDIPAKITRGNDAQIAVQGDVIIIAWTKLDETARFNAGAMLTARSVDEGQSWQYAATPPDWEQGSHGYIDLAADKHAMHAVWLDSRSEHADEKPQKGLRYARSIDGGLSWQKNQSLDNLTCSCCWNTINSDNSGNPYVLYRDKQPSDLSIGVINTQQQWQRLNHVGQFNWQFDGCPHIGGGFDFQNSLTKNRIHAVAGTAHPEHLGVHYLYSDDAGKNWSAAMALGDQSAIHSDIAAHNNGRVVAVWDMMSENGLAIFAAESMDHGDNWSQAKQISAADMRASHPNIVKTEQGFLAIWTESDGQHQILSKKIL